VSRKMTLKMNPPDFTQLPTLGVPDADILHSPDRLFLFLTKWTVPYGGEEQYYGELLEGLGFRRDDYGNYSLAVLTPEGNFPTTCFAAHLDTADCKPEPISRLRDTRNRVFTDGRTILGADDRAGVTVILSMAMRDVPGFYYLFVGEEGGCIGSARVAKFEEMPTCVKKVVSFDRKGTGSIITHQAGSRTCSDAFAEALSVAFGKCGLDLEADPNGVFTDSKEFADTVPECTNISVGYAQAHTHKEMQDLDFLTSLIIAAINIDWEALPVERDPDAIDDADWYGGGYRGDWRGYGDDNYQRDWKKQTASAYQDAFSAIEDLVDDFKEGMPPDLELIAYLVQEDRADTVDMIGLLMDELRQAVLLPGERGDGD
jgi:hypothetical protein